VHFVGIDLAWSPRNTSGGAVLSADGDLLRATSTLGSNQDVLDFAAEAIPQGSSGLVAIDAPLAVPNEMGSRPCDRELASIFRRFHAGPYPVNRRNLARYGGLRGEAIAQKLGALGFAHDPCIRPLVASRQAIEVYPHPATVSLFSLSWILRYKNRRGRDYALRWRELARLRDGLVGLAESNPPLRLPPRIVGMKIEGRRGKAFKEVEDLLDSIVCAYSALYAWFHGPRGYAVFGRGSIDDPPPMASRNQKGHILVPMTREMWPRVRTHRLLFLDRDGTLNESLGARPPNHPDEVKLLPGVAATLHWYASMGWRLIIVTNQGGVAFGYQTEKQAWTVQQRVLDALPVEVEATYLCPHHPDGTLLHYAIACPNRKPNPGAVLEALRRHRAHAADCLFVGDQETDRLASLASGVPFTWAVDFFGGNHLDHVC
jgi:histidinol-phosphate phosphatase family protein